MARPRAGTPGLDIFKLAGQSISGFIHSAKTGDPRRVRQPFMSLVEERLALYLEYHPHVAQYQRGDVSADFARAHRLATPLGTPYAIRYVYDGAAHEYLPDFVGQLQGGGLLIAEAGLLREKAKGQARAKADAARRLAALKAGCYLIGTEEALSPCRHQNLLFLHARRQPFPAFAEIAPVLHAVWLDGEICSVRAMVKRFGARWTADEVEAAAWKIAGDAAADGRLVVDLAAVRLSLDTPTALLDPALPPILPDPLPQTLEAQHDTDGIPDQSPAAADRPYEHSVIPGPTVDGSAIADEGVRARFYRNLAAVTEVLNGATIRATAARHGMSHDNLGYLLQRALVLGQPALVPHQSYRRDPAIHPEFAALVEKLYTRPRRPTLTAICEDPALRRLAEDLTAREGQLVRTPSYCQVRGVVQRIKMTPTVQKARSGLLHPPRPRQSPQSFVLSIPAPAHLCQVDDHYCDVLVTTLDGTVITNRVHGLVLICVKTAAILGAVLCLSDPVEEDYMRLLKMAMESKERLVELYECQHDWPCAAKPSAIFHDRGKIFTSQRAAQVVVERLGIVAEQAPPYAPTAKGTVEALFTWVSRKFTHRLPGTTLSTPQQRGAYDSVSEAARAGLTLDVLEKYFIQAIVDGYMQEWDTLRRQRRSALWEEAVRAHGVPRWLGSHDDLALLLMRAQNRKNPATGRYAIHPSHGLSFLGRWYVSPGLLDRLRGKEIDVYYDRRDISVIYLMLDGVHVGEAYCTEFYGRRVSVWEAQAERRADHRQAREAAAESAEKRAAIQERARAGKRAQYKESKRLETARLRDLQRPEIHPAGVEATLKAIEESRRLREIVPAEAPPAPLMPAVPEQNVIPIRTLAVRRRVLAEE